jgi:hypothetical protein
MKTQFLLVTLLVAIAGCSKTQPAAKAMSLADLIKVYEFEAAELHKAEARFEAVRVSTRDALWLEKDFAMPMTFAELEDRMNNTYLRPSARRDHNYDIIATRFEQQRDALRKEWDDANQKCSEQRDRWLKSRTALNDFRKQFDS